MGGLCLPTWNGFSFCQFLTDLWLVRSLATIVVVVVTGDKHSHYFEIGIWNCGARTTFKTILLKIEKSGKKMDFDGKEGRNVSLAALADKNEKKWIRDPEPMRNVPFGGVLNTKRVMGDFKYLNSFDRVALQFQFTTRRPGGGKASHERKVMKKRIHFLCPVSSKRFVCLWVNPKARIRRYVSDTGECLEANVPSFSINLTTKFHYNSPLVEDEHSQWTEQIHWVVSLFIFVRLLCLRKPLVCACVTCLFAMLFALSWHLSLCCD